ncbi:Uncharacterised protein [Yersinia enterocolitica]|nr:Uncharacterised protein [Yersinia enterocolitica]CQR16487.1 Uncharacterised protein [Yersinia enterocolitica]CRX53177.1 Uncharacterised protein [Yersinia enterocolitica]
MKLHFRCLGVLNSRQMFNIDYNNQVMELASSKQEL